MAKITKFDFWYEDKVNGKFSVDVFYNNKKSLFYFKKLEVPAIIWALYTERLKNDTSFRIAGKIVDVITFNEPKEAQTIINSLVENYEQKFRSDNKVKVIYYKIEVEGNIDGKSESDMSGYGSFRNSRAKHESCGVRLYWGMTYKIKGSKDKYVNEDNTEFNGIRYSSEYKVIDWTEQAEELFVKIENGLSKVIGVVKQLRDMESEHLEKIIESGKIGKNNFGMLLEFKGG